MGSLQHKRGYTPRVMVVKLVRCAVDPRGRCPIHEAAPSATPNGGSPECGDDIVRSAGLLREVWMMSCAEAGRHGEGYQSARRVLKMVACL